MKWHKILSLVIVIPLLTVLDGRAQKDSTISFLALGDSYTIGESVIPEQRWPQQLADSLQEHGFNVQDPHIIAKTGWTTDELIEAIKEERPAENYDIVSLLIGVNNQYRGYDINKYRNEFEQLLEQAISIAGNDSNQVFVVSIPDYGATPFGQQKEPKTIAQELQSYNEIAREICERHQVQFINITPISKMAANDSTLVADNGLHPSGKMYQQWVRKILPIVLSKLSQSYEVNR